MKDLQERTFAIVFRFVHPLFQLNPPININAKCESGNTALHVAVSQNNLEIARMLLETGGATVDVVNMNGNGATPLHMAAMFGRYL